MKIGKLIGILILLVLGGEYALRVGASARQTPASSVRASRSVADVAAYLNKRTGIAIYCDDAAGVERTTMPAPDANITGANLEAYLEEMVKPLIPQRVTWAKLMLPAPPPNSKWSANDVLAYAKAQARLYGTIGATTATDTMEIFGQLVMIDAAKPIVETLRLRPVYLIAHTRGTFTGTWEATFGVLRMVQRGTRVTGNYVSNNGRLDGTVGRDGLLRFNWFENEETGGGGNGSGRFRLSEDGESFAGTWNSALNDADGAGSAWTGKRTSHKAN